MLIEKKVKDFPMLSCLDRFIDGHNGFVVGGCFKDIFSNKNPKDIDIFFESQTDYDYAVKYFDDRKENSKNPLYKFCYKNANCKAYEHLETKIKIELCKTVFGSPEKILGDFDFTVCKFAYYKAKDDKKGEKSFILSNTQLAQSIFPKHKILCDDKFFEHLSLHKLITDDKILYPMSTLDRIVRYVKYGYEPCEETKIKIAKAIHKLSEKEIEESENFYDDIDY